MRARRAIIVVCLLLASTTARADLVSHWKFDGDLTDSGPGGNHGTYGPATGAPTFVAGMDGSAINFNGTSDWVSVAQTTKMPVHNQPVFTIAFWVKGPPSPATTSDRKVFSEASTASNTPLWNLGTGNASGNQKFDPFVRNDAGTTILNHPKSAANAFDNIWHHVAWVDDNGTVSLYIDGVKDTTNFSYTRTALTTNTTTFGAIQRAAVSNWVTAVVDDMRFYDNALSQADVLALYQTGCPTEGDTTCAGLTVTGPPGSAPGVWTFAASGSDVSGDTAFLYSWVVKDAADVTVFSRLNATESSIGIGLGAGSYTVSVTVDDDRRCLDTSAAATCTQAFEVLADTPRLVSRYPLDGNANDAEASGNHGTIVSGADATPAAFVDGRDGTPGGAIALSGDDYISLSTATSLPLYVYPSYSVAFWTKGIAAQRDRRMYSEASTYDSSVLVNVGTDNNADTGKVDIFIRNNTGAGNPINHRKSERVAQDDTWHHVVWVDDNGWASVYIDGVRDSVDVNYTHGILVANRVSLGAVLRTAAGNWYIGAIDEVRLYNYALSEAEVSALVPDGAGCPADGDTHVTDVTIAYPEFLGPGVHTVTATGTDDSGDPPLYTFVLKNPAGRILKQVGPGAASSATFDLVAGDYTVTVTADDGLACKDLAADAVVTRTIKVLSEPQREIASWLFDGSLVDGISGNAATFLGVVDGPVYGEGKECAATGALVLDGVEDLIQAGANPGLPLTKKESFTIAFWVKGLPQGDRRIFSESSAADNNFLYNLGSDNTGATGSLDFYMRDGAGTNPVNHLKSVRPVLDGSWHHVAWSDANGVVTCWIDGVQDATSFSYTRPTSMSQSVTTLGGINRPARTPPTSSFLAGSIDDVHLYNYVLSEAQVLALFGSGPTCCPDTHCQGLTVEGPAGNKEGAWTATATAADDSGSAIYYRFTAEDGVHPAIVVGPQAAATATLNLGIGTWKVSVDVSDDPACLEEAADSRCSVEGIVVLGTLQVAGDCDQSGALDISDVVCEVSVLYVGFNLLDRTPVVPPCATAQGNVALGDVNGDGSFNVSDVVYLAMYLYSGGAPPVQGTGCFSIPIAYGCPESAVCP